ncbi:MAG: DNA mismatch repair protein MutS [Clostridia bacterium]|nr:DNA mismatch repair protein MutS [Clostridia bacterium]
MGKLSPMMQQYLKIKEQYQDSIVFFRLGDFYEMFFKDAEIASKELEITLTGRDCGQEEKAKMCGVPYHSSEAYIARLVQRGYKVAICEQTEDASKAKGVVKREVTRVVTKGTVIEGSMLDETSNNYLCAIFERDNKASIAFCDVSTGDIHTTYIGSDIIKNIETELSHYRPGEILFWGNDELFSVVRKFVVNVLESSIENKSDKPVVFDECKKTVQKHFGKEKIADLKKSKHLVIYTVGIILDYLKETQRQGLQRVNNLDVYDFNGYMSIDPNTQKNLELTCNSRDGKRKYSLLWVLDQTNTAMGKRLIKSWVEKPLLDCEKIKKRQNAVEELIKNREISDEISNYLEKILDIERVMTRIVYGSANAREVRNLCESIKYLPKIKSLLKNLKTPMLSEIYNTLDTLDDIYSLIDSSIIENPPVSVKDGGLLKDGYNAEVDYYKSLVSNSQDLIMKTEQEERQKTGIPKLKIGYNRVFGYYIEVTNSYKSLVPENYERKQTLSGCERYITKQLKDIEGKLLGAKETLMHMEFVIFDDIRVSISEEIERIENTIKKISVLDVLNSFAKVASKSGYCKPNIDETTRLQITNSRHPVIERLLDKNEFFVPNDVYLDTDENQINIITGPNMAGKSTYMRQIALIVVMAQIGSFVPARKADIGIVSKVFTRVGASDELAMGRSTFMVEMIEVANILKSSDKNSLIILDEIGRGTSTFDGMSIAQAVIEYIVNNKKIGAKTLFATHYHELTDLEDKLPGVKNYNILVKKRDDDITFLRKIVRGKADDSYGIEVAKLAGVPKGVLKRAKEILKELESGQNMQLRIDMSEDKQEKQQHEDDKEVQTKAKSIVDKLKSKDINTFTPIEAMNFLYELIELAD